VRPVAGKEERPVEVDEVGRLRQEEGGRHRQRGRHHAADHDLQPRRPRRGGKVERFRQPAGLVELDVDRIVAAGEAGEVGGDVQALVGAERYRSWYSGKERVGRGGKRLLDELDAGGGAGGEVVRDRLGRPGFVGVGEEPGRRRRLTHRRDPVRVALAAELHLEDRPGGRRLRRSRHFLGRSEAQRIGGFDGLERADPGELGRRPAGPLRLEVEEGAVDRVPRCAGRHRGAQRLASDALGDSRCDRLDGSDHILGCLAVAGIGHRFAPAGDIALANRDEDDHRLGLGAAADREAAGDRPALDGDFQKPLHVLADRRLAPPRHRGHTPARTLWSGRRRLKGPAAPAAEPTAGWLIRRRFRKLGWSDARSGTPPGSRRMAPGPSIPSPPSNARSRKPSAAPPAGSPSTCPASPSSILPAPG
jgi:hypothetical protein